jgi:hypothetical protein
LIPETSPAGLWQQTQWVARRRLGDFAEPVAADAMVCQPEPAAFRVQVDASRWISVAGHERGVGFAAVALSTPTERGTAIFAWLAHRFGVRGWLSVPSLGKGVEVVPRSNFSQEAPLCIFLSSKSHLQNCNSALNFGSE